MLGLLCILMGRASQLDALQGHRRIKHRRLLALFCLQDLPDKFQKFPNFGRFPNFARFPNFRTSELLSFRPSFVSVQWKQRFGHGGWCHQVPHNSLLPSGAGLRVGHPSLAVGVAERVHDYKGLKGKQHQFKSQ